jgi:lipoprotein-anchoring transpeptidase ErfK/SrfK
MVGALLPLSGMGETYRLPSNGSELIGEIRYTKARHEDTLIDIARENSLGQDEIVMANPDVDRWLPKEGTKVLIPRQFILPDAPRVGVVLNIPEMRLYYYPGQYETVVQKPPPAKSKAVAKADPKSKDAKIGKDAKNAKDPKAAKNTKDGKTKPIPVKAPAAKPAAPAQATVVMKGPPTQVITYPVSIGRMDWRTPLGATKVVEKLKDPVWRPPESIKKEHAKDGDMLPDVVPAGPNNPLGQFAMKLGVPGYLIHGTGVDKAYGIGMRVTHGCIRMYPEDIAKLFPQVGVGTPVRLVNQPIKLGWDGEDLYMEVHQPLDEDRISYESLLSLALGLIEKKTAGYGFTMDGAAVKKALEQPSGVPVLISKAVVIGEPSRPPEASGIPEPLPAPASSEPTEPAGLSGGTAIEPETVPDSYDAPSTAPSGTTEPDPYDTPDPGDEPDAEAEKTI